MLKYLLGGVKASHILQYEDFQKLHAIDGAVLDYLGFSVSISGDGNVALVCAYYDDDNGENSGSAYIFTKQANGTYTQTQKLLASDGAANDQFGVSVSISDDGNVALVGARNDDDNGTYSGSAYIFTKQADGLYTQTQKLLAADGIDRHQFGRSVSISGDGSVALVGAHQDDHKGNNTGAAYIFTKQTDSAYTQTQKLVASDAAANDLFGHSVSISGDGNVALVGAYGDNDNAFTSSGSAYIFTKQANGSYVQTNKLVASDAGAIDYFGQAASISSDGNVVVVGSPFDDHQMIWGGDSGSAYIFTKQANGTYTQTQKLLASDGATKDYFGTSVSISGDGSVVVVGAYKDDDKGTDSGSAYIFTKQADGAYLQTQKLLASDGAATDQFGISVSISSDSNVVLVGAHCDDDTGGDSGSMYIYK